eukprot:5956860-Prymnesium_polylepis.1
MCVCEVRHAGLSGGTGGRSDTRYHEAPRGYGILQPAGLTHKLALWGVHATGDVSFFETSNASGKPLATRCPDLSATAEGEPVV